MFSANEQDHCVIRVSRKATALPLLQRAKNLDDVLNRITVTRTRFTVEDLLSACEVDEKTARNILQEAAISPDTTIHSLNGKQKDALFLQAFPRLQIFHESRRNTSVAIWTKQALRERWLYVM